MKRILTAIVGLPILLYTVWSPTPYFFVALVAIAVVLALAEFYSLASKTGAKPQALAGYAAALVVIASFVYEEPRLAIAALSALVIGSLAAAVFKPAEIKESLLAVSTTVFGVSYIALLAGCLAGVRMIPDTFAGTGGTHFSSKLITAFFAIVMMTDTGAYYTGRTIGRHKLAPRISPGKTVEGSVGGFVAAIAAGLLCKLIFFHELPIAHALLLGAAIGAIGQIGDLAESMLKRSANVKDSGKLLPGHGGVLDRIDSILFCAPLLYFYTRLLAAGI
ncbi:MAG TPA: phosphatidate cytidylyltransferase [Blastocatellia bacterium]|nr:phosphatidate cytidylyltransferase [Blastocatellia bacterium]